MPQANAQDQHSTEELPQELIWGDAPATPCNTLQHTATPCNTLQHPATHCNTLQHTTTHCNALQYPETHSNTLPQANTQNRHSMGELDLELIWGDAPEIIGGKCSTSDMQMHAAHVVYDKLSKVFDVLSDVEGQRPQVLSLI